MQSHATIQLKVAATRAGVGSRSRRMSHDSASQRQNARVTQMRIST